jgi:uncharacterized protein (TIGR02145 family)
MKKTGLFVLILLLSCSFAWSQDTLYIYKAGIVVLKKPIADIDSITFYKNTTTPAQEIITDICGNTYHTVKIGTQTWMVENLKTTKYRNGDLIPNVTTNTIWSTLTTGAWCNYNNTEVYSSKYGKLYNWYAVSDSRNIAPVGWHVPSDAEWTTLTTYLGGENIAGGKLKESGTINWTSPNTDATNETSFSALPSGNRGNSDGTFQEQGSGSFWWSFTELNSLYAYFRSVGYSGAGVGRSGSGKMNGLAVRCVKNVQKLPVLTTTAVTAITDTTAVSGGNITDDGYVAITVRGICWSTSQNPTIADNKTVSGTGTGTFSSTITGLKADSTYYIKAYATNSMGTSYGEQISFKTYSKGSKLINDIDGNSYLTVVIGTQTWMVENLKTTKYRNGDLIQNITDNSTWVNSYNGAYCWYNNDISNKNTYGAMYNGYAISDSRNIAPIGWHVPTSSEWTTLITYLGGESVAGGKMKESGTLHWSSPNNAATNESGFKALPGGLRQKDSGGFYNIGLYCYFWNNTQIDYYDTKQSVLYYDKGNFGPSACSNSYGISVRCIKDAQAPVLTTTAVSAVTDTTAAIGGNITSDGGAAVTARGICWSTKNNPTIADNKTVSGIGTGTFSSTITGLKADSTYYVKAYATNSVGTSYGNLLSFKAQLIVTDIDGNIYHSVKIGTQTWMVENLKTTKYNDGTSVPLVTDGYSWTITSNSAHSWVNNDSINKTVYGGIYNFYAASSGKLAPTGWHIPTQSDLNTLVTFLGGSVVAGSKLKEAGNTHWISLNSDATNSSCFKALPAGYRSSATGDFQKFGEWCVLWSSTESDGKGGRFIIGNSSAVTDYSFDNKLLGFSIRCIKD